MHFRIDSNAICQGLSKTKGMKRIYPNLSLIGVNSTLNLLSFDVRLNVYMIEILQLKNLETHRKDNYVIDG